jgi:hypothetical protein
VVRAAPGRAEPVLELVGRALAVLAPWERTVLDDPAGRAGVVRDDVVVDGLVEVGEPLGRGLGLELLAASSAFFFESSALTSGSSAVGFACPSIPTSLPQALAHKRETCRLARCVAVNNRPVHSECRTKPRATRAS